MALGWIKIEAATPSKPEIFRLARILGITPDDAFGKTMRFWIWLDGVTVDGRVDGVALQDVNSAVSCNGFAEALVLAGWLVVHTEPDSIEIPNFARHNGETAKARALSTARQGKWRAKVDGRVDGRVDGVASTSASPEKRREEKTTTTPLTPQGESDVVDDGWESLKTSLLRAGMGNAGVRPDDTTSTADEVLAGCRHWSKIKGAIGEEFAIPVLHAWIKSHRHGQKPTDGWPKLKEQEPDPNAWTEEELVEHRKTVAVLTERKARQDAKRLADKAAKQASEVTE